MTYWSPNILLFVCCLPFLTADMSDVVTLEDNECLKMVKDFAKSSAAFTFCAVSHARPILICQKCVSSYLDVVGVYDNITQQKTERFQSGRSIPIFENIYVPFMNDIEQLRFRSSWMLFCSYLLQMTAGHKCANELINLDRLQIFIQGYEYITNLWGNAKCDNCFIKDSATGKLTTQLTDLVMEILNSSVVYRACVDKYRNATAKPDLVVCEKCVDSYQRVNNIYNKKKGSVEFCMDVIDLMNNTRNEWSNDIGCCKARRKPEATMLLTAACIGVLPFIFYLMSYCLATKEEHPVIERKRWNADSNGESSSDPTISE